MRGIETALVVACLLGATAIGGIVGVAAADEDPIASARLGNVDHGPDVHLEGGFSVAPDGEIVAYEWTIEGPGGTDVLPNCANCVVTRFTPEQRGVYEITLEVTDSSGSTTTDSFLIEVTSLDPFEMDKTEPKQFEVSRSDLRETLEREAGPDPLDSYAWSLVGDWKGGADVFVERDRNSNVRGEVEVGPPDDRFPVQFPVRIGEAEWEAATEREHQFRETRVPRRIIDDEYEDPAGKYVDVLPTRLSDLDRSRLAGTTDPVSDSSVTGSGSGSYNATET